MAVECISEDSKVKEVQGESVVKDHEKQLQLESFSFGVTNAARATRRPAAASARATVVGPAVHR